MLLLKFEGILQNNGNSKLVDYWLFYKTSGSEVDSENYFGSGGGSKKSSNGSSMIWVMSQKWVHDDAYWYYLKQNPKNNEIFQMKKWISKFALFGRITQKPESQADHEINQDWNIAPLYSVHGEKNQLSG